MKKLNITSFQRIVFRLNLIFLLTGIELFLLGNPIHAQDGPVRIQSDTLFLDGAPKAVVRLNIIQGISVNFNVDTYFFDPDFNKTFKTYRKSYERTVRKELSNRLKVYNGFFFFQYLDTTRLNLADSSVGFTNLNRDSILASASDNSNTPGQYLARAGRSYNLAIGLAFGFGLITPLLAPAVGSVGTIALSGVGVLSVLIANLSGNSNLIQAGKGLDKETDASKP